MVVSAVVDDSNSRLSRKRELLLTVLVGLALSYSWSFDDLSVPNERTRIYLAVALVDSGSLSIDGPVKRFGAINDWARYDGRYYTDKAPGSSLLAAIPYGVARLVSSSRSWSIQALVDMMRRFVMLPLALLGFLLFRSLLRGRGHPEAVVDLASVGWMLGSAAFHYSTAFYGHHIVAVFLLAGLWALDRAQRAEAARPRRIYLAVAGAAAGFAGLTEYQAAIPVVLFACYALYRFGRRDRLAVGAFALGAAPFLVLFLGYHALAFGGPLELSYDHLVSSKIQALHAKGVGGVSWPPTLEATLGATWSLHRGLFATSPIVVVAFYGLHRLFWQGDRAFGVFLTVTLALFLLFIFCASAWYAGWSYGPRLLVPALPLAFIAVAEGARQLWLYPWGRGLLLGLTAVGVVSYQLVTAFFPELPQTALNPLIDAVAPMAANGLHAPNLGNTLLGLEGTWSLVPLWLIVGAVGWRLCIHLKRELAPRLVVAALAVSLLVALPFGARVLNEGATPSWTGDRQVLFLQKILRYGTD